MTPLPLGYSALIQQYSLRVPPLEQIWVLADRTGVVRHTVSADGSEQIEIPRNRYTGGDDVISHLIFALKRERLNLTVLAALFEHDEVCAAIQKWLKKSPTSSYSRLSAYLAKWLNGVNLEFVLPPGAPRIRILEPEKYVTGQSVTDPQFGVVNNLLGTPAFCPIVRRSDRLQQLLAHDLCGRVSQAVSAIEPEILIRAVDYLYLSETQSTFSIEKEIPDNLRAEKFRRLLETAGEPGPLTEDKLSNWQNSIVSPYMAEASFRSRQNWLSRSGRLRNIADFVPPASHDVKPMMEGIAKVAESGVDGSIDPAIAAACASFGLVFAHPFLDGNGRLHRFLIHHILRQSGYTPQGVVLPISARMLNSMDVYSKLLKSYSQPRTALLDYVLDDESQTILIKSPQPLWLYASFDATPYCEFILGCISQCVEEDLALEVKYLQAYDRSKGRLEAWLDLPQSRLDLLIRLIAQGNGEISQRKRKHFEELDDQLIAKVEAIVSEEFKDYIDIAGTVQNSQ